jgi:lipoprotein NlpI
MKSLSRPTSWILVVISLLAGCTSGPSLKTEQDNPVSAEVSALYSTEIKRGSEKMQVGDYDAAIAAFDQAIALIPSRPIGFACRGQARLAQGDLNGAFSDYSHVPNGYPQFVFAYIDRGLMRMTEGDTAGANFDFKQAVALAPDNPKVLVARARAKIKFNDPDGAIADADQAIAIDPQFALGYAIRASAKQRKGDRVGQLADLNQVIALSPKDTAALNDRGAAKFSLGDVDGAIADYKQAIAVYPNNSFAYNGIAQIKEACGDFPGAQQAYLQSIKVEPWRATYNRFALTLILRRQHLDEAPAGLSEAVSGWKDNWAKAIGYFILGSMDEETLMAKATSCPPAKIREQQCEAYYYAGMVRLIRNDSTQARRLFEKCVATGVTHFVEYRLAKQELDHLAR